MANKWSFTFIYLISLMYSQIAGAAPLAAVNTRVHDLIAPDQTLNAWQVLSTSDGRVYQVKPAQKDVLAELQKAVATKSAIKLMVDGDNVLSVKASDGIAPEKDIVAQSLMGLTAKAPDSQMPADSLGYQPTNLDSLGQANQFFDSLRTLRYKSQCYQRAHYWAHQLWESNSVYSMKVFMFFTRRFVREHRYHWWFHVAPFVYVQGAEIVLDPQFTKSPLAMHTWTDVFMMDQGTVRPPLFDSPECPSVANYKAYEDNQETQFCYLLKLPMYYYQPLDAEKLAEEGARIDSWRAWDLAHSKRAE
ncbi:protein-glutamine glutaminase family protein [Bdellovibrionota bacterium FG-1]